MTRAVRLSAALFLAGVVLVSLPGAVWAQNTPWKVENFGDRTSDHIPYYVSPLHEDGTMVVLSCLPGNPRSDFAAGIIAISDDFFLDGEVAVSWRIDEGITQDEIWEARTKNGVSGVFAVGQRAYDLALAVANAKNQIMFRNPKGTVEFDAKGSTVAISMLLVLCGLAE